MIETISLIGAVTGAGLAGGLIGAGVMLWHIYPTICAAKEMHDAANMLVDMVNKAKTGEPLHETPHEAAGDAIAHDPGIESKIPPGGVERRKSTRPFGRRTDNDVRHGRLKSQDVVFYNCKMTNSTTATPPIADGLVSKENG